LTPSDYRADPVWDCVVSGATIAMVRLLQVDGSGESLRERIEANLARQSQPEFAAVHLVRSVADLTANTPRSVSVFIEQHFAQAE